MLESQEKSTLRCAIDLLWVRPKQVGGIESATRNLLDGFLSTDAEFEFWLLVSIDNAKTFQHYENDSRFHLEVCDVESANVAKRIIWQNMHLGSKIKSLGLDKCIEPYYCKPILGVRRISFVTVIHDLQAMHYPEYFSRGKVLWMKFSWRNAIKTSKKIVTISHYVKKDIVNHFKTDNNKVAVIYNSISINKEDILSEEQVERRYGVKSNEFYFTVSSLLPHKNIQTLIEVFAKIKRDGIALPNSLIVSGVGGKSKGELIRLIKQYGLDANIQLTEFIDDGERNALYRYCKAFLFPSIFEGFGMPPVEAMCLGTHTITTNETSIPEVTQGKASYVRDPFNVDDWINCMMNASEHGEGTIDEDVYSPVRIAGEYLSVLKDV